MIYNMMITEYLRKSVRVEADSFEEAYKQVTEHLANEEIVLSADDFADRDIQTVDDFNTHVLDKPTFDETHSEDYQVDLNFAEDVYVKDSDGYVMLKSKDELEPDDTVISKEEYQKFIGLR